MEEDPHLALSEREVKVVIKEEEEELELSQARNINCPLSIPASASSTERDPHLLVTSGIKRNIPLTLSWLAVRMNIKQEEEEVEPASKKSKQGVQEEIKDELMQGSRPGSYPELVDRVLFIEQRLNERKAEKRKAGTFTKKRKKRNPEEPHTVLDSAPSETAAAKRRCHDPFVGRDGDMAHVPHAAPDSDWKHLSAGSTPDEDDNDYDTENTSTHLGSSGTPDALPACWTEDQANYFKTQNPWLQIRKGKLGCNFCIQVGKLGLQKHIRGTRFAREWTEFLIATTAETRKGQQTALRKKIWEHRESQCHQQAVKVLHQAKEGLFDASVLKQAAEEEETTCRIFQTAYMIGRENRPFSDMPLVVELQVTNGLKMGNALQTRQSCVDICDFIGDEMKRKVIKFMIEKDVKFSILVDKCAAVSHLPVLLVYIRAAFGEELEPATIFLQLLELHQTTAEDVSKALRACLHEHFPKAFIAKNWISFTVDGVSTMMGWGSGVATLLTKPECYPNLVVWPCCSHRLELVVGDVLKEVTGTHSFEAFVEALYSLYASSSKNRGELHACADELAVMLQTVGSVMGTAWVVSSSRTVTAVWNLYPALSAHFKLAASDPSRASEERAEYRGLLETLTSVEFVKNLGLMRDTLRELAELSLKLQADSTTLPDAYILICRQIKAFEALAGETELEFTKTATDTEANLVFQGVPLHAGRKVVVEIDRKQLYRRLADSLQDRLVTTPSSHGPTTPRNVFLYEFEELIAACKVVYPQFWPEEYDILYGEPEVVALCKRFQLPARPIVEGFRDYKDNAGRNVPEEMLPLFVTLKTIATSTAECERVLRTINNITPIHDSLSVSAVSNLLFLQCNGPPVTEFHPEKYVKAWLLQGRQSADQGTFRKPEQKEEEEQDPKKNLWCLL